MTDWPQHDPITTGPPEDRTTWCKECGAVLDDSDARTPCPKGTPPMTTNNPTLTGDEADEYRDTLANIASDDGDVHVSEHDMAEDNLSAIDQAAAELHAAIDRSSHDEPDGDDERFAIEAGKDVVRSTYDLIKRALKERRAERERLNDIIAELVEAETLWEPIVHRVENGPARRKPKTDTASEPES